MMESKNYEIIFDSLKKSVKEQEELQSIDFDEIIKESYKIKVLEKIINESLIDEEPQIMTRS